MSKNHVENINKLNTNTVNNLIFKEGSSAQAVLKGNKLTFIDGSYQILDYLDPLNEDEILVLFRF